jgi:hypothetical protein
LPADALIQPKADKPVLIGFFKHDDGSQWAMVVNRDLHKSAAATLTFDRTIKNLRELSPKTGQLSDVALSGHTLACDLPPGGIKFLKLAR